MQICANTFQTISTVTLPVPTLEAEKLEALDAWLRAVLWESTLPLPAPSELAAASSKFEIHRLKGRIQLTNGSVKLLQGVREVFELIDEADSSRGSEGDRMEVDGKIVLIGRGLGEKAFKESLRSAVG